MSTKILKPKQALNKAFLKVKPNRNEIEDFKSNLIQLIDHSNEIESEEFHKNLVIDFLKKTYYDPNHYINTKGRNDLVIHNGDKAKATVGVIIEAKKPTNKSEMLSPTNINYKAFQELVLYYLRERITHKNLEVKHLIVTNINEWFIFDAQTFDRHFAQNKGLVKQFEEFEGGRLAETKTDFFYKHIAEPEIEKVKAQIDFTYFDIRSYDKPLRNSDKKDDAKLIALYKLLSPEHLLKLPFANDSNSLDKRFYSELLHIIGLTETKEGGKKLIGRSKAGERNSGSILEDAIIQLDSLDKLGQLDKPSQYGNTIQERLFNVGLELSITWVNRVLFLKLLEAQLITYHKGDTSYAFLNKKNIHDWDDLNSLFFQVLAKKTEDRNEDVKALFAKVPYLNSSLFEPTTMEQRTIMINFLKNEKIIPVISSTVLKNEQGKKLSGSLTTLDYLFKFLDAYDFASEGSEEIQEDNKTLINASVLGLIFEKINGYKDGSFFTPGFITMYMCRETIRRAVLQKFKEEKGWEVESIDALYDKIEDRTEANTLVNSIKICDPAVGSGHFLVSALNEIIAVKNDLKILQDRSGKRLKEYQVEVVNDELIVTDEDGELFEYHPTNKESQRIQETLFLEKQTIIENCLFGVDINPNSVKICRLRLWIELLKSAYYKSSTSSSPLGEAGERELETLPNIDINIKCGNSLVSRFALDSDLKSALKGSWKIEDYKTAVATYRNAKTKDEKRAMEALINTIKSNFRSEIAKNDPKIKKKAALGGELYNLTMQTGLFEEAPKDKKIRLARVEKVSAELNKLESEIEEIKANQIFENAFEWRFEFPEVLNDVGEFVGFDVVIGNPPYIRQEQLGEWKKYLKDRYQVYMGTADLLVYFFELSTQILRENAHFCMITSNKFVKANYGKNLRKYLLNYQLGQIIDFGELPVFEEAATFPAIYTFQKKKRQKKVRFSQVVSLDFDSFENLIANTAIELSDDSFGEDFWSLGDPKVNSILSSMKKVGVPLSEFGNGEIFHGIKTGFNKAFVIDEIKRDELINQDPSSEEIIFPFAIGDDIRFYHISNKKRYIILTKVGIEIERYPAVFSHLKQYKNELEKRWDKGKHWWELRACAYYEAFEKPKIMYPEMAMESRFAYVENTLHFNNKVFFIPTEDLSLLGILNSSLVWFYLKNLVSVLGDPNRGGRLELRAVHMSTLPIAQPSLLEKEKIEILVKQILAKKQIDLKADTIELENQIDQLVYEMYGLSEEEIRIVEGGQQ
ncbi:Eco57I restriction-modification methylase domain-containing protein [Algoriphagus aquimarinus]|uniref:class I SAM-dependent DNA methyltransferase n=1 Tax=Algoriphagus aquimarinus TaxID=237018 RepID=UPI0030D7F770|tara:strand:- start:6793 stop:10557 length:3765 start_codon:yes stop_codon:yes gene_type:complete